MSIYEDDRSVPRAERTGAGGVLGGSTGSFAGGAAGDAAYRALAGASGGHTGGGHTHSNGRGYAFGVQSGQVAGLRDDVTQLLKIDRQERQLAAERIEILARVDHRALQEAGQGPQLESSLNPRDTMAHRAARAEVATALHVSEQAIERQLVRAVKLTTEYPVTVATLSSGNISSLHASVILDAGEVIGQYGFEDTPEIAATRALYEQRVLLHAVKMNPNQLRPKARRIAEEYARTDLDTRYEIEKLRRKVWVRPVEDGMAELCAYLPAHEAYGIYSRLTLMAKAVQVAEARTDRDEKVAGNLVAGEEGSATNGADVAATPVAPLRRARDEIRADLLTDLLLHGTGDTATGGPDTGIRGIVQVVTHETHLLTHSEGNEGNEGNEGRTQRPTSHISAPGATQTRPGQTSPTGQTQTRVQQGGTPARRLRAPRPELEGYGPFPVAAARSIAGGGSNGHVVPWDMITASSLTGDVLRVDRYRPSVAMRRFLISRDARCRFPGCRTAAHRCEIDHTIDAALGGETSTANCGHLCKGHHRLKHHSGWDVKQHDYGIYEWTSPAGITHIEEPVSRVRFVEMVDQSLTGHNTDNSESFAQGYAHEEAGRQRNTGSQGTAPPETQKSHRNARQNDKHVDDLEGNRGQPPEDLPETPF